MLVSLRGQDGIGSANVRKTAIWYQMQLQNGTAVADVKKLCWIDANRTDRVELNLSLPSPLITDSNREPASVPNQRWFAVS